MIFGCDNLLLYLLFCVVVSCRAGRDILLFYFGWLIVGLIVGIFFKKRKSLSASFCS